MLEGRLPYSRRDLRLFMRLLYVLRENKSAYILLVIISVMVTGISLVEPKIFGELIDQATNENMKAVLMFIGLMLIIYMFNTVLEVLKARYSSSITENLKNNIKKELYEKTVHATFVEFNKWQNGELISRYEYDIMQMSGVMSSGFLQLFLTIIQMLAVGIICFNMNSSMALVMVILFPAFFLVSSFMGGELRANTKMRMESYAKFYHHITETFSAFKVIKALGIENKYIKKYNKLANHIMNLHIHYTVKGSLSQASSGTISMLGKMILWGMGAHQIIHGSLTAGQFVAFIVYFNMLSSVFVSMSGLNSNFISALAAVDRVFGLLDEISIPCTKQTLGNASKICGNAKFEEVSFSYNDARKILDNISFEIHQNTLTAIVGRNGCGKTTMLYLLMKFYEPTTGRILLDGNDISGINDEWLRKQIAIAYQDPIFLNGSIKENLQYAKIDASEKEIRHCCQMARIDEFIMTLPNKYDTMLGKTETGLSVGEMQRLSIAQVLLRQPSILLLDESTSNIDNESGYHIRSVIKEISSNCTVIVVTHRMSTILSADKIIVVDEGCIAGEGTYQDLYCTNNVFRLLCEREFKAAREKK